MSRLKLVFLLALFVLPAVPTPARAASPDVVVSQIFGGGGNSGSPLTNDFVELFNRGSTPIDLSGWTVQYATASSTSWQHSSLSGTIAPGGYFLVQEASGGTVGAALPTADALGSINLSSSSGKIALVRTATALTCGGSPGSCASDTSIADLVGYGSASDYEGSGAVHTLSNTTAGARAGAGCIDTDDNASDFSAAAPDPRNSATAALDCGGSPPPPPPPPPPTASASGKASVTAEVAPTLTISLSRSAIDFGRLVFGSAVEPIAEDVTVGSNDASGYILSVHRTAFTPDDLPLALSAQGAAGAELNPSFAGAVKLAVPIAPALDLLIGSSSGITGPEGDVWQTSVGFLGSLPIVRAGAHAATLTYTVIGR
jgi:hypothetical protein